MRHRKRTSKLGRRTEHREAMLANQACSLILEERIQTTVPKAKETRRLVEKVITLGKSGTLHHRRLAISKIRSVPAVRKVFDDLAARFMERKGGYTRIIRVGTRAGDAADMCLLELVESGVVVTPQGETAPVASAAAPVTTAPAAAPEESIVAEETLGDEPEASIEEPLTESGEEAEEDETK